LIFDETHGTSVWTTASHQRIVAVALKNGGRVVVLQSTASTLMSFGAREKPRDR
jgi:hypothetical protein